MGSVARSARSFGFRRCDEAETARVPWFNHRLFGRLVAGFGLLWIPVVARPPQIEIGSDSIGKVPPKNAAAVDALIENANGSDNRRRRRRRSTLTSERLLDPMDIIPRRQQRIVLIPTTTNETQRRAHTRPPIQSKRMSSSSSPFSMSGRRCLVTGATDPTSIGYKCAQALLAAGAAHVVVMGRDQAKVEAAAAGLNGEGAFKWVWLACVVCMHPSGYLRVPLLHHARTWTTAKPPGHAGKASGVVGDLKHPGTMAGVVEQAVHAMGGLDSLVVSGGNGGSEYLVRACVCVVFGLLVGGLGGMNGISQK